MTQRTARLDELLREEISRIISREIDDPRVGFVTVTHVDVARDIRHATVWISLIGDADARRQSLKALGRAMPFVRSRLGVLRLRRIPELHLREDDASQRGTRILSILGDLQAGVEPEAPAPGETLPTPNTGPTRPPPEPEA